MESSLWTCVMICEGGTEGVDPYSRSTITLSWYQRYNHVWATGFKKERNGRSGRTKVITVMLLLWWQGVRSQRFSFPVYSVSLGCINPGDPRQPWVRSSPCGVSPWQRPFVEPSQWTRMTEGATGKNYWILLFRKKKAKPRLPGSKWPMPLMSVCEKPFHSTLLWSLFEHKARPKSNRPMGTTCTHNASGCPAKSNTARH